MQKQSNKSVSKRKVKATPSKSAVSTPSKAEAKSRRMAAKKGVSGSVDTPSGRRSARIARKKS